MRMKILSKPRLYWAADFEVWVMTFSATHPLFAYPIDHCEQFKTLNEAVKYIIGANHQCA